MSASATKKAAAKRAKATADHQISERIRLGENAYAVKNQVSSGAWRNIVKAAHAKGYTVDSSLSSEPDDLKARLHSSLKTQAQTMVNQAFAPQSTELDYQGQQASNLRQKRLDDETAYNQWAAQQVSLGAAAANKAQQDYTDFVDKQSGAAATSAQNLLAQAKAHAQAMGTANDVTGSAALQNAQSQLANQTQSAANQDTAAHAAGPMAAERGAAIAASLQGQHAQINAKTEGDYNTSLNNITAGRLKLDSDRATSTISAYTDLLNKEIDKANANRDSAALAASLDLKAKTADQQHQEFLLGNKTTLANAKLASDTTKRGQDITQTTAERGQTLSHSDRVADRRARTTNQRLDRASRESIAATKLAAADSTSTAKRAAANQKITAVIDTIADILRTQQKGKAGGKGSGYLWDPDARKWVPARTALINRGATSAQINAGLAHARGQLLTPQQKAALGIVG